MDIRTISSKGQVTIKKNQGLLPYLLVVNQTMEDQVRKMISSDKKPSEKKFCDYVE